MNLPAPEQIKRMSSSQVTVWRNKIMAEAANVRDPALFNRYRNVLTALSARADEIKADNERRGFREPGSAPLMSRNPLTHAMQLRDAEEKRNAEAWDSARPADIPFATYKPGEVIAGNARAYGKEKETENKEKAAGSLKEKQAVMAQVYELMQDERNRADATKLLREAGISNKEYKEYFELYEQLRSTIGHDQTVTPLGNWYKEALNRKETGK